MVKLRVIRGFYDLEAKIHRKPGEIFEASVTRAQVVVAAGVATLVEGSNEAANTPEFPKRTRKRK